MFKSYIILRNIGMHDNIDRNTFECHSVGLYVYSHYSNQTGGFEIKGDPDVFYLVLGQWIQQSYPESFHQIKIYVNIFI